MLRSETVRRRHDQHPQFADEPEAPDILQVRCTGDEAASVDPQQGGAGRGSRGRVETKSNTAFHTVLHPNAVPGERSRREYAERESSESEVSPREGYARDPLRASCEIGMNVVRHLASLSRMRDFSAGTIFRMLRAPPLTGVPAIHSR